MSISPTLKGYGLALTGGLFLTVDIPTLRLAEADLGATLFARSLFEVVAALLVWIVWRTVRGTAPPLIPGRAGLMVCLCYGLGTSAFIAGILNAGTHGETGTLLFLIASAPILAALLALLFLKETPSLTTWLALGAVLAGVALIVGTPTAGSGLTKLLGFLTALGLASAITISRWSGRDMGFAPLIATILPAMLGAAMIGHSGNFIVESWPWLALNGFIVLPIAFFCLAQAPKYIPAPQAALFYLLETTLAPLWLFLIFGETIPPAAYAGGGLIIGAVALDTAVQIRSRRRQRRLARANAAT